jgi:hypothetical protein
MSGPFNILGAAKGLLNPRSVTNCLTLMCKIGDSMGNQIYVPVADFQQKLFNT